MVSSLVWLVLVLVCSGISVSCVLVMVCCWLMIGV